MANSNCYAYTKKDRLIKIFKLVKRKLPNSEVVITTKRYLHKVDTLIRAYVRQLTDNANGDFLVVINYRRVDLNSFIEFKDLVLQVKGIDEFEVRDLEKKLICNRVIIDDEINEIEYEE